MNKSYIQLDEFKLVGITARTNNANEMNPETAKISSTLATYFDNNYAEKIQDRVAPGVTYCVYTDYESDENAEYTYFVGEKVNSFDAIDPVFKTMEIDSQDYLKFDVGPGVMPSICFEAWQEIWKMTSADFGAERRYHADFEVYDERSLDSQNTCFDLFIGLQKLNS